MGELNAAHQVGSKKAIQENIKREIKSGRDPKQAAAIAYAIYKKYKGKKTK